MPATVFVAPALLGCTTWWDRLAEAKTGAVRPEVRQQALQTLGGRSDTIIQWARSKSIALQSESSLPRIGTEAELLLVATKPGVTFGSHTWSHLNLISLPAAELEAELVRPLEWLDARRLNTLPLISYPYGLFNTAAAESAEKAGYRGAFRIDGGYVPRSQFSPFAIPRLNIPSGLSIDGFRLRLAGIGARR
jgi:peptidoglycan/xylan/chitin deacetylase (PgdA/CDA1 family)